MHVNLDLSEDAVAALQAQWGNLDNAARDALLIESYRTGRISLGFLAEALGLTRWQAEHWLAERGVTWNYDLGELEADRKTLADLFGEKD